MIAFGIEDAMYDEKMLRQRNERSWRADRFASAPDLRDSLQPQPQTVHIGWVLRGLTHLEVCIVTPLPDVEFASQDQLINRSSERE
jgi:hypothetical protein